MNLPSPYIFRFASIFLLTGDAECETAQPNPDFKTAAGFGAQYYLSLPEGWSAK